MIGSWPCKHVSTYQYDSMHSHVHVLDMSFNWMLGSFLTNSSNLWQLWITKLGEGETEEVVCCDSSEELIVLIQLSSLVRRLESSSRPVGRAVSQALQKNAIDLSTSFPSPAIVVPHLQRVRHAYPFRYTCPRLSLQYSLGLSSHDVSTLHSTLSPHDVST